MSVVNETDSGTKDSTIRALAKTQRELSTEFKQAMKNYWRKVYDLARQLCFEMAYDTGTLYRSIRLVWDAGGSFGPYEVVVGSESENITALIRVGGGMFINPKSGRIVDYAAAVHDGTRYMAERPFLRYAIELCESYRLSILQRNIDKALSKFERVI